MYHNFETFSTKYIFWGFFEFSVKEITVLLQHEIILPKAQNVDVWVNSQILREIKFDNFGTSKCAILSILVAQKSL